MFIKDLLTLMHLISYTLKGVRMTVRICKKKKHNLAYTGNCYHKMTSFMSKYQGNFDFVYDPFK